MNGIAWLPIVVAWLFGLMPLAVEAHSLAEIEAELQKGERDLQLVEQKAPDFTLEDAEGHEVRLADLHGKVVILDFIYARCQDECPLQSALLAKVQAQIADAGLADQVEFVSIATDTENAIETAVLMRTYGARFGLKDTNWIFLHGGSGRERAGIDLARAYGLEFVESGDGGELKQTHPVVTHLIDTRGWLRARYQGLQFSPLNLTLHAAGVLHAEHEAAAEGGGESEPANRWWPMVAFGLSIGAIALLGWLGTRAVRRSRFWFR
jgi:protein SCO1/2